MSDGLTAADLAGFYCTENYWAHWTGRLTFTDGVKFLAERGGAYWLVDAVASHQTNPLATQEPFQCWKLLRTTGTRAVLEMTDGNSDRPILRQEIEYTDFPLDEITLYLTDGVLMLTSEY